LRIFPASLKPEEGQTITAEHVRASLTTLRRHFGHIVLDLPHAFNEVALTGLELADRVLLVATPERTTLKDVIETRRIFGEVLGLPSERLCHVLNHPQPYHGLAVSEFSSATATPWTEIAWGSDAPAATALKGESLVLTRRNNPVTRAIVSLAEQVSNAARELAALSGRSG
jgi:pilus assembly protein CpaE